MKWRVRWSGGMTLSRHVFLKCVERFQAVFADDLYVEVTRVNHMGHQHIH